MQAQQAGKDKDWEACVGLYHKVLHQPGPTERNIRYNLGVALHEMSKMKEVPEAYRQVNFVAAAKGELDLSIELAAEAKDPCAPPSPPLSPQGSAHLDPSRPLCPSLWFFSPCANVSYLASESARFLAGRC